MAMTVAETSLEGARPSSSLAEQIWLRVQAQMEHRLGRLERITMSLFDRSLRGEEVAEATQRISTVARAHQLFGGFGRSCG